jgi:hypothetical protein
VITGASHHIVEKEEKANPRPHFTARLMIVMGVISEGTTSFKLKQFAAIYTLSSLVWTLVITSMTGAPKA